MTKVNPYELKNNCNVVYTVDTRNIKVGNLTDTQLDIGRSKLNRKKVLTLTEKKQLHAINYIINYRSEKAIETLKQKCAESKADSIIRAINKWYKN